MFYAVIAHDRPDGLPQRLALRDQHFAYLTSLDQKVVFAGALFNASDEMDGSLMVIEADTLEEATALANDDPFVIEGLYAAVEVKRWTFSVDNTAGRSK